MAPEVRHWFCSIDVNTGQQFTTGRHSGWFPLFTTLNQGLLTALVIQKSSNKKSNRVFSRGWPTSSGLAVFVATELILDSRHSCSYSHQLVIRSCPLEQLVYNLQLASLRFASLLHSFCITCKLIERAACLKDLRSLISFV